MTSPSWDFKTKPRLFGDGKWNDDIAGGKTLRIPEVYTGAKVSRGVSSTDRDVVELTS